MAEATPFGLTSSNGSWNLDIDADGNLAFKANALDGGDTRMVINDESGQMKVGGSGAHGQLQFVGPTDVNTIFLGSSATDTRAAAVLGGGNSGVSGRVRLGNAAGDLTITLEGSSGNIEAVSINERSDRRFKAGITPLSNALNTILALRGVRYQCKPDGALQQAVSQDAHLGFIGQEVETVCPEVVSTDAEGYKSLHYSRLTPVLVEAMKEQQQLITQQAAALGAALAKIAQLEASMQELQA